MIMLDLQFSEISITYTRSQRVSVTCLRERVLGKPKSPLWCEDKDPLFVRRVSQRLEEYLCNRVSLAVQGWLGLRLWRGVCVCVGSRMFIFNAHVRHRRRWGRHYIRCHQHPQHTLLVHEYTDPALSKHRSDSEDGISPGIANDSLTDLTPSPDCLHGDLIDAD